MPFDEAGVPQNTEVMRDMGLRASQLLHKIRHAFLTDEQRFQDTQSSLVAQRLENRRALARGKYIRM